jgi:hypothetical protein
MCTILQSSTTRWMHIIEWHGQCVEWDDLDGTIFLFDHIEKINVPPVQFYVKLKKRNK